MKDLEKQWKLIVALNIATQQELELITQINGYKVETLNQVIWARCGYHNLEEYIENETLCNEIKLGWENA